MKTQRHQDAHVRLGVFGASEDTCERMMRACGCAGLGPSGSVLRASAQSLGGNPQAAAGLFSAVMQEGGGGGGHMHKGPEVVHQMPYLTLEDWGKAAPNKSTKALSQRVLWTQRRCNRELYNGAGGSAADGCPRPQPRLTRSLTFLRDGDANSTRFSQTHSKNATVCSTKMEPSPDAEPAGRPACSTVRSTRPVFEPPGLKSCAVSALTKMAT
ncbi:uncharacterized protein LOC123001132 isoform X1 [Ursus arctos]|uniref:uncharacterized protein LOC123001132 isoform X1 n=1 Tax=Ursus arctos TaxID=9644 RepID=UPI001CF92457|nr:uncharacterized protein LOC123001132 isoform X1 [Ursus arctos]XP_057172430.1 uncharacterized protein LOC123001132 isoform X1 [Ursus arctos]